MISIDSTMSDVEQMEAVLAATAPPEEPSAEQVDSVEQESASDDNSGKKESDSPATGGEDTKASSEIEESPGEPDDDASEEAELERPTKRNPRTRRIIRLSAEVEELKAQIAALKGSTSSTVETVAPDGEPTLEQFDGDLEKFTKATIKWNREQEKAQEAAQAQAKEWANRVSRAAEKYKDFAEVADVEIPLSREMREFIVESDLGPDIGYMLAKDPKEAQRIVGLPPMKQVKELARLELQLAGNNAPPAKQLTKASAAPPPIKPLAATATPVVKDPSKMNYQEFVAWRNSGGK